MQRTLNYKVHMTDRDDTAAERPEPPVDSEAPLDPDAMLALIEGETREVERVFGAQEVVHYLAWGAAWLVGYLVLWASWEDSGSPVLIPPVPAAVVFGVLLGAAAATSIVVGIRSNRGIRGRSDFLGRVYGISWMLLGTAAGAIGVGLIRAGMPSELAALYFPSAYALVLGAMYLAGTMLWHSIDQLVIAVIVLVTAAVTPFFGAPANLLAMALIAGIALLVAGVLAHLRRRTPR